MAVKHVCDICGKIIGTFEGFDVVISKRDLYGTLVLTKEICEDHVEELKEWLNRTESK